MKVFVAEAFDWEESKILGVFATKREAQGAIDGDETYPSKNDGGVCHYGIEEFEIGKVKDG